MELIIILLSLLVLILISHYIGKEWDKTDNDDFDFPH